MQVPTLHENFSGLVKAEKTLNSPRRKTVHLQNRRVQQGLFGQVQTKETQTGPHKGKTLPVRNMRKEILIGL